MCDVAGLAVGHYTDRVAASGTTVILSPEGAVGGVDVRGAAPGTRETDLLNPLNLVEEVQAICLSGGSVYGLATAHGVVRYLEEQGFGFPLGEGQVAPIVPAAVLYDLGRGESFRPPITEEWGYRACQTATSQGIELGSVGAGTGALAGGIKGGVGSASEVLDSGLTVAALVAVNALSTIINPATGLAWELAGEVAGEFGPEAHRPVRLPAPETGEPGHQTTIGVVATDAVLTKAQATKVAQMAHDGMARAIRPAHTMFDGDTIFCLATGKKELPLEKGFFVAPYAPAVNEIGRAAADCFSRAVIRALVAAESLAGMTALRDLEDL